MQETPIIRKQSQAIRETGNGRAFTDFRNKFISYSEIIGSLLFFFVSYLFIIAGVVLTWVNLFIGNYIGAGVTIGCVFVVAFVRKRLSA